MGFGICSFGTCTTGLGRGSVAEPRSVLLQGLVEANGRCFWSAALLEAMRELSFAGYVAPGVLLVRAGACALDVVRAAWARRVLKPPPNYDITNVGEYAEHLLDLVSSQPRSG